MYRISHGQLLFLQHSSVGFRRLGPVEFWKISYIFDLLCHIYPIILVIQLSSTHDERDELNMYIS